MDLYLVIEVSGRPGSWSSAVPVLKKTLVVGRGNNCDVVLANPKISRKALTVSRVDDQVLVTASSRKNSFHVNGELVTESILHTGDSFTIEGSTLRIENELPDRKTWKTISSQISSQVSSVIKKDAFRSLLKTVGAPTNAKDLLKHLLLGFVSLFKADRGFVLLREGATEKLVPVTSYAVDEVDDFVTVSSTIYGNVLESGQVVFIENSQEDEATEGITSLRSSTDPRTIIAAPLAQGDNVLGVVYLDALWNAGKSKFFDRELISTFCAIVAGILSAGVTRRKLLQARERLGALSTYINKDEGIVWGKSPESSRLQILIKSAGPQDVSVLLTGETGTGKEVVARALHCASSRAAGPFIPLHCAAIASELLEAELFGVEKGAFTGADKSRAGRFELAMGGTLFLDELGEIPLHVQIKLLRVLEERKVTRVGGSQLIDLDLRLICATNAALEEAVREGRFRQDLYYRINVFRIELPPLRQRGNDILELADGFLQSFSLKCNKNINCFSSEAQNVLLSYPWPGNIRELRNIVERAVILESTNEVTLLSLSISDSPGLSTLFSDPLSSYPDAYSEARKVFEKEFFQHRLNLHKGNMEELALSTGISRSTLYRRLIALGLLGAK